MLPIRETRLPGVGVRFDFSAKGGERVGVIVHRSGRRDVIVCSPQDPDVCQEVMHLDEEEALALVEAMGVSHSTGEIARLQLALGGLSIDWVEVSERSHACGRTVYDVEHVEDVDASIVAVVREGETIASPASTFALRADDTAVLVGTREGVDALTALLTRG
jgi:TrkA domain protein